MNRFTGTIFKKYGLIGILLVSTLAWGQDPPAELRVITYNLRSGRGYGDPDRKTAGERFRLIGEEIAMYRPDVLVLQEPGSEPGLYDTLVAAMGSSYRYRVLKCPDDQDQRRVGLLVISPQVLVSHIDHCIQGDDPEADQLFNHWARIAMTFKEYPLIVYGFKLAPRDRSETRRRQIDLLTPYLERDLAQAQAVIVAGDLNHRPFRPGIPSMDVPGVSRFLRFVDAR